MKTALITILALTAQERWDAMRQLYADAAAQRWFIMTGIISIVVLSLTVIIMSYSRISREKQLSARIISELSDKRGLSLAEKQFVIQIATSAGLKRPETIFSMAGAFDIGAARFTAEMLKLHPEKCKDTRIELSFLREKLGFQKRFINSIGQVRGHSNLSSRQVPVGKVVQLVSNENWNIGRIDAEVMCNDDIELIIKTKEHIKVTRGKELRVRYCFGASVWEFDSIVLSTHGRAVVLNHSDDLRFINRRRFLRVPVTLAGYIAELPFESEIAAGGYEQRKLGLPQFADAVVKELAGPGLRIETNLETRIGDRVIVIFMMDLGEGKTRTFEDMGLVRQIRSTLKDYSLGVELIGISDSQLDNLIRVTNRMSVQRTREDKGAVNV